MARTAAVIVALLAAADAWSVRADSPVLGRRARELEQIFAPPTAPTGTYEIFESRQPIHSIAAMLRRRDPAPAAGAWKMQRLAPGDAFGIEGTYDRWRVGRLYGGNRVDVVRGSLRSESGTLTAYTLLSPYPDPTLTTLSVGTMIIVFHVPETIR